MGIKQINLLQYVSGDISGDGKTKVIQNRICKSSRMKLKMECILRLCVFGTNSEMMNTENLEYWQNRYRGTIGNGEGNTGKVYLFGTKKPQIKNMALTDTI